MHYPLWHPVPTTQVSRTRFLAFPKFFFWVTRNPGTRNLKIFGGKFWVARSLENFWIPDSGIQDSEFQKKNWKRGDGKAGGPTLAPKSRRFPMATRTFALCCHPSYHALVWRVFLKKWFNPLRVWNVTFWTFLPKIWKSLIACIFLNDFEKIFPIISLK